MRPVVRFAVVGEGKDEHGDSSKGPHLRDLQAASSQGVLVTIVSRLLRERFDREPCPVSWVLPQPTRTKQPLLPRGLLTDSYYLNRFLLSLLYPVRVSTPMKPVDLVVLSIDAEYRSSFERSCRGLLSNLSERTIPLIFEPELEALFLQSREPLEAALGLKRGTTEPPERNGDLKECLAKWLRQHSTVQNKPSSEFREKVARHLDVRRNSPLEALNAWRTLVSGISRLTS